MSSAAYKRILLKISGEVLAGEQSFGLDARMIQYIASEVAEVAAMGVEVAVVIGGGNIFRGVSASATGMDRVAADHMGMLATLMNALALQDSLEKRGVFTRVMTAITAAQVAEPFIRRRAIRHLEKGRVVIFAAGTGNPYFTTDTAAALRAMEIAAEIVIKATKVDGVYTADPRLDPSAVKFDELTYLEALTRRLHVMDSTAMSLCMDNMCPTVVFNLHAKGHLRQVVCGERVGTLVRG